MLLEQWNKSVLSQAMKNLLKIRNAAMKRNMYETTNSVPD
jgi:hypothetical protein